MVHEARLSDRLVEIYLEGKVYNVDATLERGILEVVFATADFALTPKGEATFAYVLSELGELHASMERAGARAG